MKSQIVYEPNQASEEKSHQPKWKKIVRFCSGGVLLASGVTIVVLFLMGRFSEYSLQTALAAFGAAISCIGVLCFMK
ncbi:hypothetical protein LJC56_02800 [Christensenellaceae bacterium OttesenSCG-928-K19]|nr:hypothetical protein [Christensenellaceae bacterium OttesenSCG-928-K19]